MPGDPALLQGVPAALSATNLVNPNAVKLPQIWPKNIEMWFVQSESQFWLKPSLIIVQEVVVNFPNLIRNPPADDLFFQYLNFC